MTICTHCAMCCDGTLFAHVGLDPAERARMARLGQPVGEREGKPCLVHPCPALAGTRCTVYPDRPGGCVQYRCELLKAVEAGATGVPQALDVIAEARAMASEVTAALPPGETPAWRTKLLGRPGEAPPPPVLAARLLRLNLFLDRHFRAPEKRVFRESPGNGGVDRPKEDVPSGAGGRV